MQNLFNNQSLLSVVWKWKVHLMVIGLMAVLLSALFSSPYFLTPLYQSTSRLYPVNTTSFSEESESEQMLEFFQSNDIKWQLIRVFDLSQRYDLDSGVPNFKNRLLQKYDDHVSSKKTEYEAIELTVMDADPQTACRMVDSLIVFYNRKVQNLIRLKYAERVRSYTGELALKVVEIDSLSGRMDALRKTYGLLNYQTQVEQLTSGYADALARGAAQHAVNDIVQRLNILAEKGGLFQKYESEMRSLEEQRDEISARLSEAQGMAMLDQHYAMVVEQPFQADKKSWPVRWLIVLATLLSAEFLAFLLILVLERLNTNSQKS